MRTRLVATYDGQVLRPEGTVDLKPNTRYQLLIEREVEGGEGRDAWEVLEDLLGAIQAPADWATEHDHYLYGTPKRGETRVASAAIGFSWTRPTCRR